MSEPKVRRQNHSCDHCRKSKKACDGYILNNNRQTSSPDATSQTSNGQIYGDIEPGLQSCSYCTRTKKVCSLNPHWGKSPARASASVASAPSITSSSDDSSSQTKRKRNDFADMPNVPSISQKDVDLNAASMLNMMQTTAPGQGLPWDTPLPSLEVSSLLAMNPALDAQCLAMNFSSPESGSQATAQDFIDEALAELTHQTSHDGSHGTDGFDNSTTYSGSQEFDIHTLWDFSEINSAPQDSASSARSPSYAPNAVQRKRRTRLPSNDWSGYPAISPSPFTSDSLIMESSNRHFITESLLQIYHDVLENNLACWLAEDNCPYKMERRSSSPEDNATALSIPVNPHRQSPPFPPEWGTSWSNRMYRRVIQLDRVAQATKMIRLTRSESQAASRVLDLVIMAFTTQWAQGSRRQERCPMERSDFGADTPEYLAEALNEEFEESFQQSVWEQAKRALTEVADVESYRVIYAELIFGLTQKPWVSDGYQPRANIFRTTKNGGKGIKESTMPEIIDIMTQEGPHIYLERAVRKIHALKFRFEASESGFAETSKGYSPQRFSTEDRRTIGLLYWLAVMFDTVSSTMNERPVALTDEDCHHEGTQNTISENAASALKAQQVANRWEIELFIQDNAINPAVVTRWPCSYDDAMQTVAKSAPVKILIYRHLSYLQNALRKRESGPAIEDIIQQTTMVYRYWNMTHGAFFRDLVKHYDTVPPRIRSWFFCIAVPWHLGALMLADLLEFIDDNELGLKQARQKRLSGNVATRIRKASAIELSDLARVTSPRVVQEAGAHAAQLPDYHFSVSEGPLLTEPWTVILIRAFTKACIFHLDMADDFQQHERDFLGHDNEDFKDSLRRAECCIRALWCLGKKSEMSKNITKVLIEALRELKL